MGDQARSGTRISLPKISKPVDRVFEANISKIGLLGPDLAEDLAYVYNQLNAFREMLKTLMDEPDISAAQQALRVDGCITTLKRAAERGDTLPTRLRSFAKRWYVPFRV
jgi:hypothetical protein